MIRNLIFMGLLATLLTACIGSGKVSSIDFKGTKTFPTMTGIDLLGEERPVPQSFEGKYNIVTVAFERDHQDLVNPWIDLITDMMATNDAVRYYELPVIYEMSAAGRWWVNNGMRSGIPDEAARERTITIYTDRDSFAKEMGIDMTTVTTMILDNNGKILWRAEGVPTDQTLADIQKVIR